jgi:hypothetical protein
MKLIRNHSVCLQKYIREGTILLILFMISANSIAQVKDTATIKKVKEYKNTVKINLTSFVLYNGFQLNYERVLTNKSSFTVWGGPVEFPMPSVISNSSLQFNQNKKKSGYTFGADYRFYLAKENKYAAPRGVYLAPYVSFYHFNNQKGGRDTANGNNLTLNTTMNFFNVGGELGYQFVIKNRFVIDCVLVGPALTSYYFNVKLDGDLSNSNENLQAIIDALKEKYPVLKDLTNGEGISKSGISNFWSIGFRYAIHIGYRF